MAVIGTFGSFTAARLGIYASQASLNVTGNNIANINTKGYTRQKMDLVSLHSWGTARYANKFNKDIGYGVLTESVSQLRDPFMDIRYRNEQANVGASETWLKCLQQISHTLDEVGMGDDFGVMEKQFNDFAQQLQQLNGNVGTVEYDTTVRASAEVLCNLFKTYSQALDTVENNQLKNLKDDVTAVNTILTQIRDLNVEIREAGIHGAKALELRDARNVLIDDLASYMKIDVSYDMEKIDEFNSVERLNINIAGSGNPPTRLICGTYGTQLEMPDEIAARNPNYNFNYPNDPKNAEVLKNGGKYYVAVKNPKYNFNNPDDPNNEGVEKYVAAMVNPDYHLDKPADDPDNMGKEKYVPWEEGHDYAFTNNAVTPGEAEAEAAKKGQTAVNDPENPWALAVNNAKTDDENEGDNRTWMRLQPLVDEKGRIFMDADRNKSTLVDLGDDTLYGSLQSMREFVTGKGEFSSKLDIRYKNSASEVRGVPYYRKSLDALARKFAEMFNEANTDENGDRVFVGYETEIDKDGIEKYKMKDNCDLKTGLDSAKPVVDALVEAGYDEPTAIDYLQRTDLSGLPENLQALVKDVQKKHLGEKGHGEEKLGGGVLFSNDGDGDNPEGITAANISISKGWSTGETRILNTKKADPWDHSTADDNIAHMINLMSKKLDYKPQEIYDPDAKDLPASEKRYFNGSFQGRLADMNVILAVDEQTTTTLYNSYSSKSLTLENERQSVSGVDLNDEATNMMMFQKSYSAACQLMTTLDSMLERLINGTIRS